MPLRKTEYDSIDALNDAINQFPFNDNSKFVTVSLKPLIYKESFKNQHTMSQHELKQFIECIATDAIVVTEATKKNNVHYHIIANSEHLPETIDDFVRNFKKLGNTFTAKCNDPNKMSHITVLTDNEATGSLRKYVTKDFERTEALLNGLYKNDYSAPAFRYTYYEKKPVIKRQLKKILKKNPNDIESDDEKWLCAETASEIFISAPPKPATQATLDKINKKLAEKYCINFDD